MWISDAGCDGLGEGAGGHELDEVARRFGIVVGRRHSRAMRDQPSFDGLVDDEVHDSLADAEVRGDDAFVETHDSLRRIREISEN